MRRTAAFVEHELRLRWRSVPFRLTILVYLALAIVPVVLTWKTLPNVEIRLGAATFALALQSVHPGLTALLAAVLAAGCIIREHEEGSWAVVSLTGMSHVGYLMRRWVAIVAILLPLSFVPVLSALALALASGQIPMRLGAFLWPWILHVGPLCLVASALGLAIGTIAGSLPRAVALFYLLVGLAGQLLEAMLTRLHWTLGDASAWVGIESLIETLGFAARAVDRSGRDSHYILFWWARAHAASEGIYDPRAAASEIAVLMAVPLAMTLLLLILAPRLLRRTRPDHRPWKPRPDHPLRTLLGVANRFRERYAPDPGWTRSDALFSILALGFALAVLGWKTGRELDYRELAKERYEVEVSELPEPTPLELVPGRWAWRGAIDRQGRLEGKLAAEMVHQGDLAVRHLAFEIQTGLTVKELTARDKRLTMTRRWNRLAVEVEPPLEPGSTTELRFTLEGRPLNHRIPHLKGRAAYVFQYERWSRARLMGELASLAPSQSRPALSSRGLRLLPGSLFPIPRYASYELTEPRPPGDLGRRVPEEILMPQASLEVHLEAPAGSVLVDSCGTLSREVRGRVLLSGGCRVGPAHYSVRGGERIVVHSEKNAAFLLALPEHRELAELHLPALEGTLRLFEQAWPGMQEAVPVAIEVAPPFTLRNGLDIHYQWEYEWQYFDNPFSGRLVLIPEAILALSRPMEPRTVVARAVENQLWERRRVLPEQAFFFRQLISSLVDRRLGLGPETGAVILHRGLFVSQLTNEPLLGCQWGYGACSGDRMAAVLADLEHRVGAEKLREGLDLFFDSSTKEAGNASELIAILEELSGSPLQQFFDDFIAGTALPELSLQSVELVPRDRGWKVRGKVENLGSGEANCPVVLMTDLEPVEVEVVVGEQQTVAFEMATPFRPQSVELDPWRVCHRYQSTSVVSRMDLERDDS